MIVDQALIRDAEKALQSLKLPAIFSAELCSNGCNKDGPGEVGSIIACGGVAVRSGDIIIADRDGVAVVPLGAAPEIAKLSLAQMEREEKRLAEIAKRNLLFRPEIDEQLRKLKIIE